ncbi:expressed unknown protein [Seminavis robusta]|uniref:Uncharacterized protein n=1 Tax=Seminavis robusta TaxID=568900 RepID=A0A9N8ER00_9STRA|nr:expressed unknown protein [Seminavis robusta]|eukprot:Sro1373_g267230.1 n/a (98) ;mRNA; f:12681-13158
MPQRLRVRRPYSKLRNVPAARVSDFYSAALHQTKPKPRLLCAWRSFVCLLVSSSAEWTEDYRPQSFCHRRRRFVLVVDRVVAVVARPTIRRALCPID